MIEFASCESLQYRGVLITFSDSFHFNLLKPVLYSETLESQKTGILENTEFTAQSQISKSQKTENW